MRQYRDNSWYTGKSALLLSLFWLWKTPRKTKLVSLLGQVPCSRICNTSLLNLSPAELILKFLPWITRCFAWFYLVSPALSARICLRSSLISPVSSSSPPPWELSPMLPCSGWLPFWGLFFPSSLPSPIQPFCYCPTKALPRPNSLFSPHIHQVQHWLLMLSVLAVKK